MLIFLDENDIVSNFIVDAGRASNAKGYIYIGSVLLEQNDGVYNEGGKRRFFERQATVIIGKFEENAIKFDGHKRKVIMVPRGTEMFFCRMNDRGILSSIGAGYSGKEVTAVIHPLDNTETEIS